VLNYFISSPRTVVFTGHCAGIEWQRFANLVRGPHGFALCDRFFVEIGALRGTVSLGGRPGRKLSKIELLQNQVELKLNYLNSIIIEIAGF
jgi:hypothetical protein